MSEECTQRLLGLPGKVKLTISLRPGFTGEPRLFQSSRSFGLSLTKAEVTSMLCLVFVFTRTLISLGKTGSVSLLNLSYQPEGLLLTTCPVLLPNFISHGQLLFSHSLHSQCHLYFLVCYLPPLLDSTSLAHGHFPFVQVGFQCMSDVQHKLLNGPMCSIPSNYIFCVSQP